MMRKYLKLIIISICILFINIDVSALYGNSYSDLDRGEMPNHGVNKKWVINDSNIDNVNQTPVVDTTLKIYDYSNVLDDNEKNSLREKINKFIDKYKTDLVIVTIEIQEYGNNNEKYTEMFAADFYDYNDFGIDFSNYSGIVLVRNTYVNDKYYDMYTFGDAQLYFDQKRYDQILDDIYSLLSTGRYYEGFDNFIKYVTNYYEKGKASYYHNAYIGESGEIKYNFSPPYLIALIISIVVTAIIIRIYILKNRMVVKATQASNYYQKNKSNFTLIEDNFLTTHTTSYVISSSSGGGGGGHSSFGSSGGFHSSGGGRHG